MRATPRWAWGVIIVMESITGRRNSADIGFTTSTEDI